MPCTVRLHDERSAFRSLEALIWKDGPVCPHCQEGSRLGRLRGSSCSVGTWKCYACRKPFTVRHGTLLQNSHVPLHVWLQGIYLLVSSRQRLSSQKLGQILGISSRAAWTLKGKVAARLDTADEPAETLQAKTWPPLDLTAPQEETSPSLPGQATCRARYERFLEALDNLSSPCSDVAFFHALHHLLSSTSSPRAAGGANAEGQQLELSLFEGPKRQMGGCGGR
nr:transposase [Methylobacterium sp. ZNC0032]